MTEPTLASRLALRERPDRSPVMFQRWRELLFLHWVWDPADIQRTLPPGLTVDTFEGKAYLGIVPFYMRQVRPRFCPTVPGLSNFLELNVRTYVYDERGVAGVWFYSLDANQWLAVQAARLFFKLPYFYAKMAADKNRVSGEVTYRCGRRGTDPDRASRFRYRPAGQLYQAKTHSLEFFLVERYILFARLGGGLATGQVHHSPYPLYPAEIPEWDAHAIEWDGFAPPERPPDHVLMSPGVTVDIFGLERV